MNSFSPYSEDEEGICIENIENFEEGRNDIGKVETRQINLNETEAFDLSHIDNSIDDAAKLNMLNEAPLFNLLIKRFKQVCFFNLFYVKTLNVVIYLLR